MKIKQLITSVLVSSTLCTASIAQCTWPANQLLPNGNFECNDYSQNSDDVINGLGNLFNQCSKYYNQGFLIQDLNDIIEDDCMPLPSMHGWYRKSQVLTNGNSPERHAWGEFGETGNFAAPEGSSHAIIHSGTIIYRATDINVPLDPNKYYRISARIKEECSNLCDNESFTLTRNRQNFNFGMTTVTTANANNGPLQIIENANTIALPGTLNVQTGTHDWFQIQTQPFQVPTNGQYWLSAGYFDYDYTIVNFTDLFSAKMHIDDIVLEEVCIEPSISMSDVIENPCPLTVTAQCSSTFAEAHTFLVYECNSNGIPLDPNNYYSSAWIGGNVDELVNFADFYTPGFQVGHHYLIKCGIVNCFEPWADDVAMVTIQDPSSYAQIPPSPTSPNGTAVLNLTNYAGNIVRWEKNTANPWIGTWVDAQLGTNPQITLTGITSLVYYRAVIECGNTEYTSLHRSVHPYNSGGGGPRKSIGGEIKNDYIIYPNPANDLIKVHALQEIESIVIRTISGQLVFQQEGLNTSEVSIDISNFSEGTYFVTTRNVDGIEHQEKLQIQHN